ncbi:hypothetical protein BDK51DRAFT_15866 [Blyttiomyces helicus]|uniref:Helicase ATP-binding domain-containing protein n=1 Tax=Blyttiomyces helicus TaxID=388810 RepID=A0A4P9W9I4_9FUNG|nr:hypothetical protein BDK51DRAFT_15866 [Blyttiomyces helicus]|eukprot:RKO89064.1 hypothetical protein BDK51DRAFT_15866 [Blyttiomyces helicus]
MGILTNSLVGAPALLDASCVCVDEAHERSLEADLGLALLKNATKLNPNLHLVVMSADFDADRIASYFGGCHVVRVPGRSHPIEIRYAGEDADPLKQVERAVDKCVALIGISVLCYRYR